MPLVEQTYYTVLLSGNIAGFAVQQQIQNVTSIKPYKDIGKTEVIIEGTKLYLTVKDHESIQVIPQESKITNEEKVNNG